MRLGKLSIKNRIFFKDVTFDFNHTGLTVVHGLNLNAGNDSNSNAAGKSLLFSNVQDLCYTDVLVGSRRDRVTKGSASLEFLQGKNVFTLVSEQKKSSYETSILKNGKDLGIREKAEVQNFLRKFIPDTLSAYATLCHLDNSVPHPIIRGDTAQRKKFFTEFFELDSTDSLRKLISLELDEIKSDSKLLADKQNRLANLGNREDLEAKHKELKLAHKKLEAKVDQLSLMCKDYSIRSFLRQYVQDNYEDLVACRSKPYKYSLDEVREQIEKAEDQVDLGMTALEYQADRKAYKKNKDNYLKELEALGFSHSTEVAKRISVIKHELARLAADEALLKVKDTEVKKLQADLEHKTEELQELNEHKNQKAKCKYCGSVLKEDNLEEHKRRIDKSILSLTKSIKSVEEELNEALSARSHLKKALKKSNTDELQAEYSKLQDLPVKPKPPAKPDTLPTDLPDLEDAKSQLKKLQEQLTKQEWTKSKLFSQAVKLSKNQMKELIDEQDPTDVYLKQVDRLHEVKTSLREVESKVEEFNEIQESLEQLKLRSQNAEALQVLSEAYGPKGIRKILINTICQSLQDVLNRYAKTLFMEDYSFELEMETQFHILVHRKVGGKLQTSDVRRLSGAERSLFSLLLWCSLLSFVPKEKRPNFVIMDELDANMSTASLERFLSFIPKMLSIVDHVIVVTPKSKVRYEDYIPNTRYLTVVKKGAVAKLKEGKFQ